MRRLLGLAGVLAVLVGFLVLSAGVVPCQAFESQPSCYVALEPGPAENSLELLEVAGTETFASAGQLLLTTISVRDSLNLSNWFGSVTSSTTQTVPRNEVFPAQLDSEELRERNLAAMRDSQLTATIAALTEAGFEVRSEGARIALVTEEAVTDQFREGDVIVAVGADRTEISDSAEAVEAVQDRAPGETMVFHVLRDGEELTLEVELGESPEVAGRAYVGVLLTTEIDLPVEVTIDAGAIGGPSAGLMFALAIVDVLGEEDLTGGQIIAGTGTIGMDGQVGPVGGVRQKVVGATTDAEDHPAASVFLVPRANLDDVRGAPVRNDVTLVPVDNLTEALADLAVIRAGEVPEDALRLAVGR